MFLVLLSTCGDQILVLSLKCFVVIIDFCTFAFNKIKMV